MEEGEIFWAAKFLVDRWGDYAAPYAGRKANELLVRGDSNGCDLWRRIRAVVTEIQGEQPTTPTMH